MTGYDTDLSQYIEKKELLKAFARINSLLELTNTTLRDASILNHTKEFTIMASWFGLTMKTFKTIYENIINSRDNLLD